MSDTSSGAVPPTEPADSHLVLRRIELSAAPIGRMINIISIIAGAISLIVVISVVVLALFGNTIPDVLSNWGGIILGFYFGQFINLVKDYMGVIQTSSAGGSSAAR
jgi:uncharacterized RDD family membrane protein YckC